MCEKWKKYVEGLLNVSEERRADVTARPGMVTRVVEKAQQNMR